MSVKVKIWGPRACFTRIDEKVERYSYDVLTPTAAQGILKSIYWKPSIEWVINRIHVINPVVRDVVKTNEITEKMSYQKPYINKEQKRIQRVNTILTNVEYIIEANVKIIGEDDNVAKHLSIFNRRIEKGQCFAQPYLGLREYTGYFEPVDVIPKSKIKGEYILGMLPHSLDYSTYPVRRSFFLAKMVDGIIDIPAEPDIMEN